MSTHETREDIWRRHNALAREGFADHTLTEEGPGRWRCARPGIGRFAFRVVFSPRCVIVIGDLSDAILRVSDSDSLGWLLGSWQSRDYVVSKIAVSEGERAREQFVEAEAVAEATEAGHAEEYAAEMSHSSVSVAEWREWARGKGIDEPGAVMPGASLRWVWSALSCFVRLYDEKSKGAK